MDLNEFISEYGLYLAYILLVVAVLSAVILPLVSALNNPKSLLKTLGAVVVVLVVFFIAYAISSGEVLDSYRKHGVETAGASKFVGGTLITLYMLIIIALVSIVVTEIKKAFN